MTTAMVDRGTGSRLRRPGDALPRASIGVVPLVWTQADDADRWDAETILDQIARLGYEGTQLGVGFPAGAALAEALGRRGLRLAEVYAAIPATTDGPRPDALAAVRADLERLHAADGEVFCVAVDGSADRDVAAARAETPGTPAFGEDAWVALVELLHRIADEATDLGHPTVFHPHAATYVETPAEIDRLLALTDGDRIGICLDTGHHLVAGGDPVAAIRGLGDRLRHVHLKDVDPDVLGGLHRGAFDGLDEAVRHGLFTELGAGLLDLDGVIDALVERDYDGWLMVEQDRAVGPPSEAAAIGRRVLGAALRRSGGRRRGVG